MWDNWCHKLKKMFVREAKSNMGERWPSDRLETEIRLATALKNNDFFFFPFL